VFTDKPPLGVQLPPFNCKLESPDRLPSIGRLLTSLFLFLFLRTKKSHATWRAEPSR
jgi:hypothetical protein